eukprot:GFUD01005690.1.p1 GENE.GFUD01005690.1~~GFUD01005690.1.p1  ORF type:complete len:418 (+),score=152.17 GFUD01005690.1:105-1358(+)
MSETSKPGQGAGGASEESGSAPQKSQSSSQSSSSQPNGRVVPRSSSPSDKPGASRNRIFNTEKFVPKEDLVKQIMDMGICRNGAVKALYWTGNQSALAASNWIFDQPDRDLDTPLEDELEMIRAQQAEREREEREERDIVSHMCRMHHHHVHHHSHDHDDLDEDDIDEEDMLDEDEEEEEEEDDEEKVEENINESESLQAAVTDIDKLNKEEIPKTDEVRAEKVKEVVTEVGAEEAVADVEPDTVETNKEKESPPSTVEEMDIIESNQITNVEIPVQELPQVTALNPAEVRVCATEATRVSASPPCEVSSTTITPGITEIESPKETTMTKTKFIEGIIAETSEPVIIEEDEEDLDEIDDVEPQGEEEVDNAIESCPDEEPFVTNVDKTLVETSKLELQLKRNRKNAQYEKECQHQRR